MAGNEYRRYYAIFRQEDDGRSAKGAKPSGHMRIEVRGRKGRLDAYFSGLPKAGGNWCILYLLKTGGSGGKPVAAGRIPVAGPGGHIGWEFDPYDVGGSGSGIEDYDTAVLVADDGARDPECLLVAYRNGQKNWREAFYRSAQPQAEQSAEPGSREGGKRMQAADPGKDAAGIAAGEAGEAAGEAGGDAGKAAAEAVGYADEEPAGGAEKGVTPPGEDEAGRSPEEEAEQDTAARDTSSEPACSDLASSAAEGPEGEGTGAEAPMEEPTEESTEETGDNGPEDVEPGDREPEKDEGITGGPGKEEAEKEEPENEEPENEEPGKETAAKEKPESPRAESPKEERRKREKEIIQKLEECFDNELRRISPFRNVRSDYTWWKVDNYVHLNNILQSCGISAPLLFNRDVMAAHARYKHLIAGIFHDRSRDRNIFVCGVPGAFMVDTSPFGNLCRWAKAGNYRVGYGSMGYWLVYVDPTTGNILKIN